MDFKKINKRAAASLTVVFVVLLLGFALINGAFYFMSAGVDNYNATIPEQQNETFTNLFSAQDDLDDNINQIKDSVANITVQTGTTQFLWNSFQGLGSILKLPLTLINVGVNSVSALVFGVEFVPSWVQNLIILLISILVALVLIAAMTGGNPNI